MCSIIPVRLKGRVRNRSAIIRSIAAATGESFAEMNRHGFDTFAIRESPRRSRVRRHREPK
jgi:hypothetical protein